ncbi:uncharacterized protein LOC107006404 [Solanum pennellii]|uniref:Uncharacterized protein LOC107006404 n=1 Tax=Solanum pennellii TaxID=28526 RepID=A0ABM1FQZ7_SOLPN|nr:uncharacterized protein LOC107006404 [Solanum pennellii]
MTTHYHPGKTNVVADALTRKAVSMGSLAMLQVRKRPLARDVQSLANSSMRLDISETSKVLAYMEVGLIMEEAHSSRYFIHPGATKMYRDLKQYYWWCRMKRDIVDFVSKCLNCQQVKDEHQKPGCVTQRMPIPEWKWERIAMALWCPSSISYFDAEEVSSGWCSCDSVGLSVT